MSYTTLASGGSYGDRNLRVYLYPNRSRTDNECKNAINNALQRMGDDLIDANSIDYYSIRINYSHPELRDDSKGEFKDNFSSWYESEGYGTHDGCHTGVSSNFYGGRADASNCSGCTSFVTDRNCVVGVGTAKENFKNTAIQEVLHTYIREYIDDMEYWIDDNEHDLGQVYGDGSVSPMATGYTGEHAYHGECSPDNGWRGYYDTKITGCTKGAVYDTAKEET